MSGEKTKGSGTGTAAGASTTEAVATHSKGPLVFAFGRFQPPHAGHGVLIHGVGKEASELGGTGLVFATSTQDEKKNPLDVKQKLHYLKKMFPTAGVEFIDTTLYEIPTMPLVLDFLKKMGYGPIYMATGSDHLHEYSKIWTKYGVDKVIGIGENRKEAEGNLSLAGLSATKMRTAAKTGNRATFAIGTKIGSMENKNVNELMATVAGKLKGGRRRRRTLRRRARRTTRKAATKN
jgi:hypothetical protein